MNSADYRVRRATTDDLPELSALWKTAQLPADELEKRFTEFQIAEDAAGKIVGAIGMQLAGSEGKIHSETFADFALADRLRPLLWERLQSVATNHGLFRLWTDEPAPFWKKECGFAAPTGDALAKLPVQFGKATAVLQLKEDRAEPGALEAEFARFKAEEKARADKIHQQARMVKGIAIGLTILLFIFCVIGVVVMFRYRSHLQH